MSVRFHIEGHDGPLDVLLALIQKNEVSIYDIPIAQITEQFLDYIHREEQVGLQDLSDFYRMAADLIWIKSQILLPREVEFPEDYTDPREELVERLLEYSRFKKYSELLMGTGSSDSLPIERKPSEFIMPFSDSELWENVEAKDLLDTFLRLLRSRVADEKVFNVYEEVTEKEKTALMLELLDKYPSIKFSSLFSDDSSPMHIICAFMAVLDAVKDKTIHVRQDEPFSDMIITRREEEEYGTE